MQLAVAHKHGLRAATPDHRMQTLVAVLCLPLLESLQQVGVAHSLVHRYHGLAHVSGKGVLDVIGMTRGFFVSGDSSFEETPRVDSFRAAVVLWLLVRARAVEEGRPYPGPHALDIRSGIGCDGEAVVML